MSYTDEQIMSYLSGDFSELDENTFTETLQEDNELRERVRVFREMDAFLTTGDWSLTDTVEEGDIARQYKAFLSGEEGKSYASVIEKSAGNYFNETPKSKQVFVRFGRLAAAASVLLLAVAALFWMTSEPSGAELYAEYRDSVPLPSLANRDSGVALDAYGQLMSAGEYEAALDWLSRYMEKEPKPLNPQLYLHKGVLELNLDQADRAIKTFGQLRDSRSIDADKAYWYLALAYLKKEQKAQARVMLEQLAASGSSFNREAAAKLMKALD